MSDREWTEMMIKAGIPMLEIVGNLLRWENYRSLFSLIQVDGGKILAFDSGPGYCMGLYSYGRQVNVDEAPTWEELFESYGIQEQVQVVRISQRENKDGEERMCEYFKDKYAQLEGKKISILTGASPCNAKCAGLLAEFAAKSKALSIELRFFRPYTQERERDYKQSLSTIVKSGISCSQLHPALVDPSTWMGARNMDKAVEWLKKYNALNIEFVELLEQQIKEWV